MNAFTKIAKTAADCAGMELPNLPGYIVLGREQGQNAYFGMVENSFSLGKSLDHTQFHWSGKAYSNFGTTHELDGLADAEESKAHWSKKMPEAEFQIWDIADPNIPVAIDWDGWRAAKEPADTLSGVKDKFGARNPKFFMKEDF